MRVTWLSLARRLPIPALVVLLLAAAGCVPEDEGAGDVAAAETSAAVAASMDLVGVSGSFEVSEALGLLPVRLARAQALEDAVQAMVGSVRDAACLTVDTDQESFVEVTFDACPAGLLRLREIDGSLRAELDFETAPCGLDECPVAARFTLSTPRLRMGARFGERFVEMAGSWSLRDAVAAAEPTTWDAGLMISNHLGGSLAMSSRAAWVTSDQCTTVDLDAELTVAGGDEVGTIVTAAREVTRCAGACPSSGTVQVAYGLGDILAWTYTGEDTVIARGPRGQRVEMVLPCAGE